MMSQHEDATAVQARFLFVQRSRSVGKHFEQKKTKGTKVKQTARSGQAAFASGEFNTSANEAPGICAFQEARHRPE
jgi:hypothetical protein